MVKDNPATECYAAVKNMKVFCPDLEGVPDIVNEQSKVANIILNVPFV